MDTVSPPAAAIAPFDAAARRLRRDRAARRGDIANPLMGRIVEDLLDRLDTTTRPFARALDLGCGFGPITGALRGRGMDVVPADAGALFAAAMDGVQCDEDRLPFPAESFDLIISAGTLDSVNDLPGALVQARRLLRPDGLFLAAFVGAGSLPRLKRAMQAADEAEERPAAPHVHPQIDVRAAGDLLSRAGFALPVADTERMVVRYRDHSQLVGDLRSLGWTNVLNARSRHPLGRLGFAGAAAAFADGADPDGRIAERFDIIHLSGWAPSPEQPKPAQRGSGAVSLADALKPKG